MHQDHNCGCPQTCPDCAIGPFSRNHYFTGKLLVERDFRDEQTYYIDKLRHHDQRLHGWGVVCGLDAVQHPNAGCQNRIVLIQPGAAVDCCGHDIVVRESEAIDITTLAGYDAIATDTKPHTLQICLRYKECPTEKIPVLYDDCACDDTQCAPNRIIESWEAGLVVDPPAVQAHHQAPILAWNNSVNIAHPLKAVAHEPTMRLYVLTADGVVFPVRTDNHSVLTPVPLPASRKALEIAVSNDGQRLYVVVDNNPRDLLVFDTTDLASGAFRTLSIVGSAAETVELAVIPDPAARLVALLRAPGHVMAWQTDIDSKTGTPAAPDDIALTPNLQSLAVATAGDKAYALEPSAHRIQVADLVAKAAGAAIAVPPGTLDLDALAVVRSPGPDRLAVAARTEKSLTLLQPGIAAVQTVTLDHPPESLAISQDSGFAWVIEHDGASYFLQPVSLAMLWLAQTGSANPPFPLPANAVQVAPVTGGLYVSWSGDAAVAGDGGVAIIDVTETNCLDLLNLKCCTCDTADCVVIATIDNYRSSDRMLDESVPPSDPMADAAAHISRINNRKGRRILPSVQSLLDVVECVAVNGAGKPGPKGDAGPKGDPGPKGDAGPGLNKDLPKILDINWDHGGTLGFGEFQESNKYDAHPKEILRRPNPMLTIYFNVDQLQGISHQTFLVSIAYPQMIQGKNFTGLYDIVNLYGFLLDLGPQAATPHTGEPAKSAWAFVPYREFFNFNHNLFWDGFNNTTGPPEPEGLHLDLPVLRVCLKGDFIYTGKNFKETAVLDADNIGGCVGSVVNLRDPSWISGGKNPSGDLVQGGDFESWFFLKQSDVIPGAANTPQTPIREKAQNRKKED